MARSSYSRDPYWLTARYPGACAKCSAPISRGDRAFYYPLTRTMYGAACGCGETADRDFDAAAMDEDMLTGGGWQ